MDIFKQRFEMFYRTEIAEEKARYFYKDFTNICLKKCMNFSSSNLTNPEKQCLNNCSSKLLKQYLPLYKTFL